jgi:hypothetical protein
MSASSCLQQHPRFGFTPASPYSGTLTNAALTGTSFVRPAGLVQVLVMGVFTTAAPVVTVDMILEGSNDNTNWTAIASLGVANYFTTTGTTKLLGGADTFVDTARWYYLRVRAVQVAGGAFSLSIAVAGIEGDSEAFDISDSLVRTGASKTGTTRIRPAGTRYANAQIVASNVVLGGAGSFLVTLEVSSNNGTTWYPLTTVSVAGNGSSNMSVSGSTLLDLGPWGWFRFTTQDVGGVGTSYTIVPYLSLDSIDWVSASGSGSSSGGGSVIGLVQGMLIVQWGAPSAEVLDRRTTFFQVLDGSGAPVTQAMTLMILIYDTSGAGFCPGGAAHAVVQAVADGATAVTALGSNQIVLTTSATGSGSVTVEDLASETTYMCASTPNGSCTIGQLVWKSDQVTLTYA